MLGNYVTTLSCFPREIFMSDFFIIKGGGDSEEKNR